MAGNIANARNPADFRIVGKPLGIEPIAIMIRKDDRTFKGAVDGINIPLSDSLKAAFLSPNDRPAEAYEDR